MKTQKIDVYVSDDIVEKIVNKQPVEFKPITENWTGLWKKVTLQIEVPDSEENES